MLRQISQKRFYLCKDVFGSTVIMFWGIDSVEGNAYPLNLVFLYGKGNLLLQSGRCWRTWWLPPSCFSTASHLLLVSHVFTWWWASLKTGHWETSASGFFSLGNPYFQTHLFCVHVCEKWSWTSSIPAGLGAHVQDLYGEKSICKPPWPGNSTSVISQLFAFLSLITWPPTSVFQMVPNCLIIVDDHKYTWTLNTLPWYHEISCANTRHKTVHTPGS